MTLKFLEVKWVAKGHSQKSEFARASVFQEVGGRGNPPIFFGFFKRAAGGKFFAFSANFRRPACFARESPPLSLALRLFKLPCPG